MPRRLGIKSLLLSMLYLVSPDGESATLEQVKERGFVKCGVSQGLAGFSSPNQDNQWSGIDVDFCRALSAAIFGSPDRVKYTPLSAKERFTALQTGEIDILSRNTSWTLQRDAALGLSFVGVNYYDGQGFMVRRKIAVNHVDQLGGATICTQTGTTTELNTADYFRARNMTYHILVYEKNDEVVLAYEAGRCDVITADQSGLYAARLKLRKPEEHIVLPQLISKEPLGPAVRHGDDQWADINRWTLYVLFEAEELGLTQSSIEQTRKNSMNPAVKRFLGSEGNLGKDLGLTATWAYDIIRHVGNYGEIFERNLGQKSPLKIERGLNQLWNRGGLHYAIPFR